MATTRYSFAQLEQIWTQAGGSAKYAPMAAAVAMAESGGRPDAVNTSNSDGSIDRGLWQINSIHGGQSTLDPLANARAAVAISKGGTDWRPWCTAWSNGRCGGTFLGSGAPVFRYLPSGSTTSGVVPTGGSGTTTATGTGNPVLVSNPIGGAVGGFLGWVADVTGLTDSIKATLKLAGYVLLIILGFWAMIIGAILLVLSNRRVQEAIAGGARIAGETAIAGKTAQRIGLAPNYSQPPAPPEVTPPAAPPPQPTPPPTPLFPVGPGSRRGLARNEDIMRGALVPPPRQRPLKRKPRPGAPSYEGSHRREP